MKTAETQSQQLSKELFEFIDGKFYSTYGHDGVVDVVNKLNFLRDDFIYCQFLFEDLKEAKSKPENHQQVERLLDKLNDERFWSDYKKKILEVITTVNELLINITLYYKGKEILEKVSNTKI